MSTRLAVNRIHRLTHQLQLCSAWSRGAVATFMKAPYGRITSIWTGRLQNTLLERSNPIWHQQQRMLTCSKELNKVVEDRNNTQNTSKEHKLASQSSDPMACQSTTKGWEDVLRQKKTLQRAMARFKSRLELFKIYTRYRERRKVFRSLAAIKRYMSEKRLKFGAIAKNPERLKRLRMLKGKMAEKSAAFRLSAAFAIKKYGKLGAGIYFGVYIVTLILMNILTFNGYLSADDLRRMLEKVHMNHFKLPDIDSGVARFTVAYLATKALEPLRFLVSLILIMGVNRVLKR